MDTLTYLFVDKSIYFYWQVGILIIIQASININFFFLGSEKLPTQASVNAIGAIGAAIIIIIFFNSQCRLLLIYMYKLYLGFLLHCSHG